MPTTPKTFVEAVQTTFSDAGTKWVVLGDTSHGEKSLKCLAAAAKDGHLNLARLGVKTVLFEGARKGQELTAERGVYKDAVTLLRNAGLKVVGCEDNDSLSTQGAMDALMDNPPDGPGQLSQQTGQLLDKRITDANDSWSKQLQAAPLKAIICCGTSHLPRFLGPEGLRDFGLVVRLGFKGGCSGFAAEQSNADDGSNYYYPELPSANAGGARFGQVEAIGEYAGWRSV